MVVHIGVVLIAVAFAASHSFAHQTQLSLKQGQTASFDGHTFTFLDERNVATATHTALVADVRVDGKKVYGPAISDYPFASEAIGTPSVDSSLQRDIYLTFAQTPATPTSPVSIGVIIEPLVSWIWIGGAVMLGGAILSAWPGRRRPKGDRAKKDEVLTVGAPEAEIDGEARLEPSLPAGATT
jgi:cytochrome c-type biogenesis protein CcmF